VPTTFSYGLRLLPPSATNLADTARPIAPLDRPHPTLATRNIDGLVSLTPNGSTLAYTTDGTTWRPFTAPFAFPTGGPLNLRSTSPNGQTLESTISLAPFVDRRAWTATASSFQPGEGNTGNILDGNPATFWHSQYTPTKPSGPHFLVIDLAAPLIIKAVILIPRQDSSHGRLRDFELYLSNTSEDFGPPLVAGTLPNEATVQTLALPASHHARFVKIVWISDHSRQNIATLAEITIAPADQSATTLKRDAPPTDR